MAVPPPMPGSCRSCWPSTFRGQKLKAVINTHWHWAQSGFNATARKAGADVLAHENTRLWLSTEVNSRWEGQVYKRRAGAALPNKTFYYGPQSLPFGGGAVEYVHLGQAHTDGDVYVRFAEENVIVAGDIVVTGQYPSRSTRPATAGWAASRAPCVPSPRAAMPIRR